MTTLAMPLPDNLTWTYYRQVIKSLDRVCKPLKIDYKTEIRGQHLYITMSERNYTLFALRWNFTKK